MADQPIHVGDMAPDFELLDHDRSKIKLSEFRGRKNVVLLFYPMDFSSVCTQEHCTFGPAIARFAPDPDTLVFGVSCDSPFSHAAFRKQYAIPYALLADPTRKMVKAYGMWAGEEPYNCSKRGTVVINKQGRISYYHEQPMKEPRRLEDLAAAVATASE